MDNIRASNSTAGYFVVNRSASNAVQVYKDGASLTTSAEASTAITNRILTILALAGPANFSTKQASIAHVGGSLTGTQVADTDTIIDTYIAGL